MPSLRTQTTEPPAVGGTGTDLIGELLGDSYQVLGLLDEGGMGTVLLADHLRLHRRVAIKVLAKHLAGQPRALERFQTEAEIVARLEHPHIVSVLDYDTTPRGEPYIVMELLRGESLEARLERAVLSLAETTEMVCQIASGLAAAHDAAIVHRDLKPANIFLVDMPAGEIFVKLLDFGLGKHVGGRRRITLVQEVLGTPAYMAPEQATGSSATVDHRADQFALAAIVYRMLSGASPFEDDTIMGTLHNVAFSHPEPLSEIVIDPPPREIDEVVGKALSKSPSKRYDHIVEFADAFVVAASAGVDPGSRPTALGDGRSSRPSASSRPRAFGRSDTLPDIPRVPGSGSWDGSADPAREVIAAIERARAEIASGDVESAVASAEAALQVAEAAEDHAVETVIELATTMVMEILERSLGGQTHRLGVDQHPCASDDLSPRDAFVMSWLDGGATVEEVLDMAGDRMGTLRTLVKLARKGMIH